MPKDDFPVAQMAAPAFFLGLAMSQITGPGRASVESVNAEQGVARFRGLSGTKYEISVRVVDD